MLHQQATEAEPDRALDELAQSAGRVLIVETTGALARVSSQAPSPIRQRALCFAGAFAYKPAIGFLVCRATVLWVYSISSIMFIKQFTKNRMH